MFPSPVPSPILSLVPSLFPFTSPILSLVPSLFPSPILSLVPSPILSPSPVPSVLGDLTISFISTSRLERINPLLEVEGIGEEFFSALEIDSDAALSSLLIIASIFFIASFIRSTASELLSLLLSLLSLLFTLISTAGSIFSPVTLSLHSTPII